MEVAATKNKKAETVAEALLNKWIWRHGNQVMFFVSSRQKKFAMK
jgi:hypothetical protein